MKGAALQTRSRRRRRTEKEDEVAFYFGFFFFFSVEIFGLLRIDSKDDFDEKGSVGEEKDFGCRVSSRNRERIEKKKKKKV